MVDPFIGKVVSGLLVVVLGKLGSGLYKELAGIYGVRSQFRKLEKTLSAINAVVEDAEEQQYANNSIRNWLANLKELVYDIEDLLDLVSTDNLERKVNGTPSKIFRLLTGRRLYSRYTLTKAVNEICGRLDEIEKIQTDFNLRGYQQTATVDCYASQRETSSYVMTSDVFGREHDRDKIVSRLVSSSIHENEKFVVFPLIGMGGIGKTTLAKLVFNDARVNIDESFDLRLWAHVSDKFVLKTVIGGIIQSATMKNCSSLNLEALQSILHQIVKGRSILLVLD